MERENSNSKTFNNSAGVRVTKGGLNLIIGLPDNQVLRKPVNYFCAILNNIMPVEVEQQPKEKGANREILCKCDRNIRAFSSFATKSIWLPRSQ